MYHIDHDAPVKHWSKVLNVFVNFCAIYAMAIYPCNNKPFASFVANTQPLYY